MPAIDIVVIGAGQAGLAASRLLTRAGRDHVVLERGRIAERWRTERWDSLRLLSPNWMTRLPDWQYRGRDPDDFMTAAAFTRYLASYAESFAAPVVGDSEVQALSAVPGGYRVATASGVWQCRQVVIATGALGRPHVPSRIQGVALVPSTQYRNPRQLPAGGVLVVGASSSGVQIADELNAAGRDVVLAVGRHTRMPRSYRGMDIFWWLEATGRVARTIDDVPDAHAARREPSMQLIGNDGSPGAARDVDLPALHARGVRLAGRVEGVSGSTATFRDDLSHTMTAADVKMNRFLDAVDEHVQRTGLSAEVWPGVRPISLAALPVPRRLNLRREGIHTVVLAAGHVPNFPWLQLPITAPDGSIRQRRGVTRAPGVYVVGMRFQHRRDSAFIDGVRHDAASVVRHMLSGSAEVAAALPSEEPAV
jgi:putative flavoprotein involved in K+ transport